MVDFEKRKRRKLLVYTTLEYVVNPRRVDIAQRRRDFGVGSRL